MITGKIYVGDIGVYEVGKRTSEVCIRNSEILELFQTSNDHKKARSIQRNVGDSELIEIFEAREPNSCKLSQAVDANKGFERSNELRRECDWSYGAVLEMKGLEC